mgnify:CR=1 FL=1
MLFQSTSDTIVAGMLLSLTYLKLIQLLQPFTDPGLNRIKETSIWQIFFVFLIALLLKTNAVDSDFLTVCLLLIFFMNFILLVGQYVAQCLLRYACVGVKRDSKRRSGGVEKGGDRDVSMEMEMDRRTTLSASLPGVMSAITSSGQQKSRGSSRGSSSRGSSSGGAGGGGRGSVEEMREDAVVTRDPSSTGSTGSTSIREDSVRSAVDTDVHTTDQHAQIRSPFHCETSP